MWVYNKIPKGLSPYLEDESHLRGLVGVEWGRRRRGVKHTSRTFLLQVHIVEIFTPSMHSYIILKCKRHSNLLKKKKVQ